MGMGLLRWLLWPRRPKYEEDEPPRRRSRGQPRRRPQPHHPGVYRIEVDGEAGRFHGDGAPFSFWSSSRIILILSFLLWWIPPAGPMIAGYVGGRRAGSPIKAVIAALMPVFAIYIANITYAHNFASHPADFVAQLPMAVGDAAASILPFLLPYKQFMISYLQGFVQGLATTFGMATTATNSSRPAPIGSPMAARRNLASRASIGGLPMPGRSGRTRTRRGPSRRPGRPTSAARPRSARSRSSSSGPCATTTTPSYEFPGTFLSHAPLSSCLPHVLSEVQLPHVPREWEAALQFLRV